MKYTDVIAARHSVRKFEPKEVSREIIDSIIEDALTAPSSKNTRSSGFMVIDEPNTIEALSQMRTSGSTFMAGAPAAIVVLGDSEKTDLWEVNCAISATFIQLSAVDRGLGSCWVHVNGRPRDKRNPEAGNAEDYVRDLLGVKDNMRILCVIALGYEAEDK